MNLNYEQAVEYIIDKCIEPPSGFFAVQDITEDKQDSYSIEYLDSLIEGPF